MLDIKSLKEKHNSIQAVEMPNGWTVYIKSGLLHRDDGPAVLSSNHQEWYQNGKLHNDNGPARLFHVHPNNGSPRAAEWWTDGKPTMTANLDHKSFNEHLHKGK